MRVPHVSGLHRYYTCRDFTDSLTVPLWVRDLEIMNTITCKAHSVSIPAVHRSRQSLDRQYWYSGGHKVSFQIVFEVGFLSIRRYRDIDRGCGNPAIIAAPRYHTIS